MDKYSIENLVPTFLEHSIESQKRYAEDVKNYPDAEWAKDPFDISQALHSICEELIEIRRILDER